MKIKVRVTPNSKSELVEQIGPDNYILKVKERPTDGKANAAVINLVASHFNVRKSKVSITKGLKSREKTIEIETENSV
jgi:uncharacterized protein (TIGR00251 family)